MSATDLAAWFGASTGLASLAWNIYLTLTSGPKLTVSAFAGMVMMPPPPGNPKFLSVSVTNRGTTLTTITTVGLYVYDSWWATWRRKPSKQFVIAKYHGPEPPIKLEVGGAWRSFAQQDDTFNDALKSDKLWVVVFHSFSKKPAQAKIAYEKEGDSPKGK